MCDGVPVLWTSTFMIKEFGSPFAVGLADSSRFQYSNLV